MPQKENRATAKLLMGAGFFQCIAGLYWYLSFSLSPDFGSREDLLLSFGGLVSLGMAWVARRHCLYAASFALAVYVLTLVYLHWRGLSIVATGMIEYFIQGVPLILLIVALASVFRATSHATSNV